MKIEDPHAKTPGRASPDAISAWLVSRIPPSPARAALVMLAAIVLAAGFRVAVMGVGNGIGATQAFFPAIVVVTLYAGWRWALGPILACVVFAWWLWAGIQGQALNQAQIGGILLFLVSASITTALAQALRTSLINLAQARQRYTDAEAHLRVTQTAAGVGPW